MYGYSTVFTVCFRYHSGQYTIQQSSYLGKIVLVSLGFQVVLIQIIIFGYTKILSLLYIPTKYQHLIGIDPLRTCSDTMRSPIHHTNTRLHHQGPRINTKETPTLSNPMDRNQNFEPKEFTPGSRSKSKVSTIKSQR